MLHDDRSSRDSDVDQPASFLARLRDFEQHGAIVCSGSCSEEEIAQARADDRFFVDSAGFGFVLRSSYWLATREQAHRELMDTYAVTESEEDL